MPARRIAGSAGTLPQASAASPASPPGAPPAPGRPPARGTIPVPPELEAAIASAGRHRALLMAVPGVVAVRGGYKFVAGRITRTPAVVVSVRKKTAPATGVAVIPPLLPDGMPTDVTTADPLDQLAAEHRTIAHEALLIEQAQTGAEGLEAVPLITYAPPTGASLAPVTGAMTVTCHVSPDAGWAVLGPFLQATRGELVLGMYDFTAPHLYRTVRSLLRDSEVTWTQVLDRKVSLPKDEDTDSTKADDKTEGSVIQGLKRVAGARFRNSFASTGSGRTFASAYHIKVAVRDRDAFWLSSGNWQSSNQPDIDFFEPSADRKLIAVYNREWHAVVESPELAAAFHRYLEHDFDTASTAEEAATLPEVAAEPPPLWTRAEETVFEERSAAGLDVFPPARFTFGPQNPLTVQPILTPDNYLEVVLELLRRRPRAKLYFQNQSLNPVQSPTPEWAELLELLAGYSRDEALDVRIIFRNIGPIRKKLESLQAAGFNMERVRVQAGCHNKGIVVDSNTILLGSHNWTNQGVQANRDASLLIRNEEIAQYYERVFLHDWERLSRPTIREEAMPTVAMPGAEAAGPEAVRIAWSDWVGE